MFQKSTTFLLSLFISTSLYAKAIDKKPLPMWIDHQRETIDREATRSRITPVVPPASFRLPAEYEPAQAVVIGWAAYTSMLKEISKYATQDGGVQVWIAEGPSYISGVTPANLDQLQCPINTVWMRDYGPFGINEENSTVAVVDSIYRHYAYRRHDDRIPTCVAGEKGIESYPMDLILDGGNLMVDSKGNLFMTKRTYLWNNDLSKEEVDARLKEYFNVHTIHALDYAGYPGSPADGTGHIDMFVKLLNDSTVLITETDDRPFKEACDKAYNYFNNLTTPSGGKYKIIRVKGWSNYRTWYTYTNSLIVNNVVLVPSYSRHSADDQAAKRAYEEGMPGVKVRLINSDSSITSGGSIHCVTQLIPAV